MWLPDMFAIEDFVVQKSQLSLLDPLTLLVRLFKVYQSLEKEKAQPFAEFMVWGTLLLADFDEIDQYLADGEKVFNYLDELKSISKWNPDGSPLTAFEKNYLGFYNSLAPCYSKFREQLLENKECYFGLAFDKLLSSIKINSVNDWGHVIFAGFNALTPAEERLISVLRDAGKAEIFWDVDAYYLENQEQEAGHFFRKFREKNTFGPLNWIGNDLLSSPKNIRILGIPGDVGQAKLAGNICKEVIARKGTTDGVAVVLVDEGMLLPVLNSIPGISGDFNVTMGFPLKQTPVFPLLDALLTLFTNAVRLGNPGNEGATLQNSILNFYHKDIRRLLLHPLIVSARTTSQVQSARLKEILPEKSFYDPAELVVLLNKSDEGLADLFRPFLLLKSIQSSDVMHLIRNVIGWLRDGISTDDNSVRPGKNVDMEFLYQAALLCGKMDILLQDPGLNINMETLQRVINGLFSGIRLPFYGEPLHGLQVMGMLETRLLDFSDIILISANEGLLPKGKHQNTFIPDDVRAAFGLQRYSERNAVFAYHFYRLMQRVENAWLLYNSEGTPLGGGEKSRFLTQLLFELPLVNPHALISETLVSLVPGIVSETAFPVVKTDGIMMQLRQLAEKGVSPSAIITFVKCPLKFYYAHVLRIAEVEEVTETIDAAALGEIVHEALYQTYNRLKDVPVTAEILGRTIPAAVQHVKSVFASRYSLKEISAGKNLLIAKIAENMVKRFILSEQHFLEKNGGTIDIKMLEEWLSGKVQVTDSASGEIFSVNLKGKTDRIDRYAGVTRIIDYKTGRVEAKELKAYDLADIFLLEDFSKLLQVLIYAFIYAQHHGDKLIPLESGIISLRSGRSYFLKTDIANSSLINQELLDNIETELSKLLEKMFNKDEPFVPTDNRDTCKLCQYSIICNRLIN